MKNYRIGFPLITGRLEGDKVTPSGLRVWSGTSSSNLCQDDVGMGLTVGENTVSGCLVKVSGAQVQMGLFIMSIDDIMKKAPVRAV